MMISGDQVPGDQFVRLTSAARIGCYGELLPTLKSVPASG